MAPFGVGTAQAAAVVAIAEKQRDTVIEFKSDLLQSAVEKRQAYEQALTNFAIHSFITRPTVIRLDAASIFHPGYSYAQADPFGTADWKHTQVVSLINAGEGNCFALASLFKILSDRLQSGAKLCTAPGHIYIRHADPKGTNYNVELGNGQFPGTGTLQTLTYTSDEAVKSGIALRELTDKQAIGLCLIYLAKGYANKFQTIEDDFLLGCAEETIKHDALSLNALLLKSEVLETRLRRPRAPFEALRNAPAFQAYEQYIAGIFALGYLEMPQEMKNLLVK